MVMSASFKAFKLESIEAKAQCSLPLKLNVYAGMRRANMFHAQLVVKRAAAAKKGKWKHSSKIQ